ncbi:EamA family transporter [bacterium]|nr:EamA family transporter [bacterium]
MLSALFALFVRIFSNPVANLLQKIASQKNSSLLVNLYSFLFLSLACVYPANLCNWSGYGIEYWMYVFLAGFLCTIGSVCLIKALQIGEISVLGPINSYKCLVGLVIGWALLGEIPSITSFVGVLLVICGSWFIFDTVENGWKPAVLLRKEILLRFCALICTGCEAVILKKIILMSSIGESFILWCFSGFLFSLVLMLLFKNKFKWIFGKNLLYCLGIAVCLGLMQYSTNIVFTHLDVGLSLALFQLSGIVSVFFGYKIFKEQHLMKKIFGTVVMIVGSCFILIY